MGQSPMLMPISSITPYDVGLQNWVDTVAGKIFLNHIQAQLTMEMLTKLRIADVS